MVLILGVWSVQVQSCFVYSTVQGENPPAIILSEGGGSLFFWRIQLRRNVKRFRGGLVFKAHRRVYHSTKGLIVMKKKRRSSYARQGAGMRICIFAIFAWFLKDWTSENNPLPFSAKVAENDSPTDTWGIVQISKPARDPASRSWV